MFNDLGYYSVFNGQKAYNGCAILSKYEIKNSAFSFPGIENDEQSRWLSAEIEGLMICNLYLPNGNPIITKKLDYKLLTFFILPPSKEVLFERLSNRDMKDKLIVEERMKQFSHDVLRWINYDYVVVNDLSLIHI